MWKKTKARWEGNTQINLMCREIAGKLYGAAECSITLFGQQMDAIAVRAGEERWISTRSDCEQWLKDRGLEYPGDFIKEALEAAKEDGKEKFHAPITLASRKHHIKTHGQDRCPYCRVDMGGDKCPVEYGALGPTEDGTVQQQAECKKCGGRWMDVFRLVEVRDLARR